MNYLPTDPATSHDTRQRRLIAPALRSPYH
jgi:hypothetical protein